MSEINFQGIFDKLQEALTDGWKKVIFFAAYTEGSYSMKFYTDLGDGVYVDCFKSAKLNKMQLIKLFMEIDKELSVPRKESNPEWTVLTMIVDEEGNMSTKFDYEDVSDHMVDYERKWKEKYLQQQE